MTVTITSPLAALEEKTNPNALVFEVDFHKQGLCRTDLYDRLEKLSEKLSEELAANSDWQQSVFFKKIFTTNAQAESSWTSSNKIYKTTLTTEEMSNELAILKILKEKNDLDNVSLMAIEEYKKVLLAILLDKIRVRNATDVKKSSVPESESAPSTLSCFCRGFLTGVSYLLSGIAYIARCIVFSYLALGKFSIFFIPVFISLIEIAPLIVSAAAAASAPVILTIIAISTILAFVGVRYAAPAVLQQIGITAAAISASLSQIYVEQCDISHQLNYTLTQGLSHLDVNVNDKEFTCLSSIVKNASDDMMKLSKNPPSPPNNKHVKAVRGTVMLINVILSLHVAAGVPSLVTLCSGMTSLAPTFAKAALIASALGITVSGPLLIGIATVSLFAAAFAFYQILTSATVLNAFDPESANHDSLMQKLSKYIAVNAKRLNELASEKRSDIKLRNERLETVNDPKRSTYNMALKVFKDTHSLREQQSLTETQVSKINLDSGQQLLHYLKEQGHFKNTKTQSTEELKRDFNSLPDWAVNDFLEETKENKKTFLRARIS